MPVQLSEQYWSYQHLQREREREREREEEGKKSGGREGEVRDINKDIFGVPEAYCMTHTHTHTHPLIQTLQMITH